MPARRPQNTVHRDYDGSPEDINGLPPSPDQIVTGEEFNDHTDTMTEHADTLDILLTEGFLRWRAGFEGILTWVLDENGAPVGFHSATGSTAEQRAATVPGTNSAVWARTQASGETDLVATYSAAKA